MKRTAKTLSIYSFIQRFPDEVSAVSFFEKQIWGDNPVCPHCGSTETTIRAKRNGHRCKSCRKDFTIRTGTIFENSRLPLHKWLYAMLSGIVEVDEAYIGGLEKNKHQSKRTKGTQGRSTKTKTAVVRLKERGGQVRARCFESVNTNSLQDYINRNVQQGSVLSTDEAQFYGRITGYQKTMVNYSAKEFANGMASTNGIESVWAVFKRGYLGTFHHF